MGKLTSVGFSPSASGHAHVKMEKHSSEGDLKVLIPQLDQYEELSIASLRAILDQARMSRAEFNALPVAEGSDSVAPKAR
jgi:hypothetical protein